MTVLSLLEGSCCTDKILPEGSLNLSGLANLEPGARASEQGLRESLVECLSSYYYYYYYH